MNVTSETTNSVLIC